MRTTIDIDDDLMTSLREKAFRNGSSLKDVINEVIRKGIRITPESGNHYSCPEFNLGNPSHYDLDHALAIAENLETEELVRKMHLRK